MFEINDVSGERYTILNFWATWCAPCVEEMPMLSEFHNKTKKEGVSVIGLAIDNEKNVKEFLQRMEILDRLRGQKLFDALPELKQLGGKHGR